MCSYRYICVCVFPLSHVPICIYTVSSCKDCKTHTACLFTHVCTLTHTSIYEYVCIHVTHNFYCKRSKTESVYIFRLSNLRLYLHSHICLSLYFDSELGLGIAKLILCTFYVSIYRCFETHFRHTHTHTHT